MVIGLFVIIVLAAVGYYYYSTTQAEKDSLEASMALSKVLPEYDSGNYSVALDGGTSSTGVSVEGLATIVSKYGGTNGQGRFWQLYLHWRLRSGMPERDLDYQYFEDA